MDFWELFMLLLSHLEMAICFVAFFSLLLYAVSPSFYYRLLHLNIKVASAVFLLNAVILVLMVFWLMFALHAGLLDLLSEPLFWIIALCMSSAYTLLFVFKKAELLLIRSFLLALLLLLVMVKWQKFFFHDAFTKRFLVSGSLYLLLLVAFVWFAEQRATAQIKD